MKLMLILLIFINAFVNYSIAQQEDSTERRNALYLELGGNAPVISLNYERIISNHFSISAGLGFDIIDFKQENQFIPTLPINVNYYYKIKKNQFEIGFGITPFISSFPTFRKDYYYYYGQTVFSPKKIYLLGILKVGYKRYIKNWFVNISYSPIIFNNSAKPDFIYQNNIGLSVGKQF